MVGQIKSALAKTVGLDSSIQLKHFNQSMTTSKTNSFVNEMSAQEKVQITMDIVPDEAPPLRFDQLRKQQFLKDLAHI